MPRRERIGTASGLRTPVSPRRTAAVRRGQLDWTWWQNVLAILGGVAFMLVAIAVLNVAAGHPLSAIPERIGKPELAAFGGQVGSFAGTIAANLALLAVIYAVFVYGLGAILIWVGRRLAGQLASSLGLLAKAVPLLAIFALLSFTTEEMWGFRGSVPTNAIRA